MDRVSYNGYIIEAKPHHVSGGWNTNISIEHHVGSHVDVRPFSATNTFNAKEEAIKQCIIFGKRIIDGKVSNCSVSDL